MESAISALAWLPKDADPIRKRTGEVIGELRAAREALAIMKESSNF